MYDYDSVAFGVVKNFDTNKINESFRKLYQNDREIFPAHDFAPKVWENRWFNNETIVGYPVGYCVWKNAYTEVSSFLELYGELVYNYSQQNEMLQNVIVSSWEDVKAAYLDHGRPTEGYDIWKDRYCNVISGYSKVTQTNITKNSQITYLKIEITKSCNPAIEINGVSVYTDGPMFNFAEHSPFFSTNGTVIDGELSNIVDGNAQTSCKLRAKNGDDISEQNAINIVIQLGTDFLSLKSYQNWKIKFKSSDTQAYDFNLYCSEDGEDWAYLDQVVNSSSLEHSDKFRLRNTSYRKRYLEPLFDYGPFSSGNEDSHNGDTDVVFDDDTNSSIDVVGMLTRKMLDDTRSSSDGSLRIELYISKINDNKCYLSDDSAWRSLVLSDETAFSSFISTEIDTIFSEHMKNYHFGGNLSSNEINQVLLKNDMSNFDIDEVQSTVEVKEHDQFINSDGFDYVVDYKRTPTTADVRNGKTAQLYKWYRLWNSGLLEHGGIVKCNPIPTEIQSTRYSYISVNLKWESSVPIYNYDEISSQSYGNQYEQLYYGDKAGSTISWKELIRPNSEYLGASRYIVSLTPTILISDDIQANGFKYHGVEKLKSHSYPDQPVENKNNTYLVNEVHHVKNDSFCFTRSDTDTLDGSKVQYYQYYTIGYKADWKNYDYDIKNTRIDNLQNVYYYKGKPINPTITLFSDLGKILIENTDYKKELRDNAGPGTGKMIIIGIGEYHGTVIYSFKIATEMIELE